MQIEFSIFLWTFFSIDITYVHLILTERNRVSTFFGVPLFFILRVVENKISTENKIKKHWQFSKKKIKKKKMY